MKSNPQTAASIYIETFNDTATVLVPANTPLPTVWQGSFSTAADKQAAIDIHLIYGTSLKASEDKILGQWTISGIPALAKGEPHIIVKVLIDISGNVSVQANIEHNALAVTAKTQIKRVPIKGADWEVKIIEQGRCGHIQYIEKGQICQFDWEIGGGGGGEDSILTTWVPSEAQWAGQYPWAKGRRQEILDIVANEARRQRAPSSSIRWEADRFHLMNAQNTVQAVTLECANSKPIQNPTEGDIDWLFANDEGRGDFVTLSYSKQYYIQAAGEGSGFYILELREGDKQHHFRCTRSLSKQAVQQAFLKYLRRDTSFIKDFVWENAGLK